MELDLRDMSIDVCNRLLISALSYWKLRIYDARDIFRDRLIVGAGSIALRPAACDGYAAVVLLEGLDDGDKRPGRCGNV